MNNTWMFEIIRFGFVGAVAAAIHFFSVVFLVEIYQLPPLIANVIGFCVAFPCSYVGHRYFTFRALHTLHRHAIIKSFFIQSLSFAANESLYYILLSLHIPYALALCMVLTILAIFTFISSRFWVFR